MKKGISIFILSMLLAGCQSVTSMPQQEIVEDNQGVEEEVEELSDVLFNLNELGDEYLQHLTFLGRLGGHDLYLTVPYTLDHQAILYQTSASRLDVIKEVMLGMSVFKVKILDNQLYVITEEELFIFDEELEVVQVEGLPDVINGEGKILGCDFNQDLTMMSYSNTEGLWLWNQGSEPVLLAKPIYYDAQKLLEVSYYGMQRLLIMDNI